MGRGTGQLARNVASGAFFVFGLCALTAVPVLAERETEIDVVVDMTPQGRKVLHPDLQHPVYYLPAMSGFMEIGTSVAHGEKPPPEYDVAHLVAVALSHQGYLVAADPKLRFNAKNEVVYADGTAVTVAASPAVDRPIILNGPGCDTLTRSMVESSAGPYSIHLPSEIGPHGLPSPLVQVMTTVDPIHGSVMEPMPGIIITIQWGDMHAGGFIVPGDPFSSSSGRIDLGILAGMIAGTTFDKLNLREQSEIVQRTRVDRYFVVIGAYDFESCLRGHKGILLWSAKMSVPSNFDANFDRLLPILISAGEPHFGRESKQAEFTPVKMTREGRVIVGTPVVKDYQDLSAPTPPNPSPTLK